MKKKTALLFVKSDGFKVWTLDDLDVNVIEGHTRDSDSINFEVNYLSWCADTSITDVVELVSHRTNLSDKYKTLKYNNPKAPHEWLVKTIIESEMVQYNSTYQEEVEEEDIKTFKKIIEVLHNADIKPSELMVMIFPEMVEMLNSLISDGRDLETFLKYIQENKIKSINLDTQIDFSDGFDNYLNK